MNCSCLICLKPMERGGNMACTGLELFGVCPSCLADARLGRLVRNGLGSWRNLAVRRICKNSVKWWVEDEWSHGTRHPAYGEGDTPEAALIAAGVKEGEG